jgi:hypothetical protein
MNELGSAAAKAEVKVIDMKVLVFRADTAGPIQELSQTMLTMPPGLLRLRERLVALGPEARIGVIDETTITSDDLGRPQFAARLVVRNLMNGQERLTLPSRELHAQLFGSWETDGGADPVAAFDAKGTRLAVMRERPDCPMKVAVNMPISVPACAEHRIDLALWDLKRREQLAETNFIVGPDIRGGVSPLSTPSALAMKGIAGAGPTTPFSLVLRGPSLASIGSSEMRSVDVDGQQMLEVVLVHRLVSIEQDNAAVSAACERLPPDLTQIDRSTWMELAPNERFHSTCVPTGSTMTSPVSVGAQD